jgi:Concanavalin A-like lectin/glucanases superfamily
MPIDVTCPKCDLILPAPDEYAGKRIRCADCDTIVDVPIPGASTIVHLTAPAVTGRTRTGDETPTRRRHQDDPSPGRPWTAVAIGGLLVALAAAGGIWYFGSRDDVQPDPKPEPKPAPLPAPPPVEPKPAPLPTPPKPIPPKPTPPVPTPPANTIPANPSDFTGLRFHIPFDSRSGSATLESISSKYVGKLADGAVIVEGRRGKALKVTLSPRSGGAAGNIPFAIDLADQRDQFGVDANAAITVCHWASIDSPTSIYGLFLGQDKLIERPRIYFSTSRSSGSAYFYTGSSDYFSMTYAHTGTSVWHHYALRRTTAGVWSLFVDGAPRESSTRAGTANASKIAFEKVGLGGSYLVKAKEAKETRAAITVDDLCVYQRALSDSEIARLAGKN